MNKAFIRKRAPVLKCDDCERNIFTSFCDYCPFAEEIHNEIVKVTICEQCCEERVMDI